MLGPQGIPSDWICTGHISPRRNKPSWSWLRKTHRNEVWHTQKTCKVPENISVCKTIHRYYMVLPWSNNAPGCLICGVVPFYWSRLDMIILQEMAEAISSKNHHVITLSWVNFWSFLIRYTCLQCIWIHPYIWSSCWYCNLMVDQAPDIRVDIEGAVNLMAEEISLKI